MLGELRHQVGPLQLLKSVKVRSFGTVTYHQPVSQA